MADKSKVYPIRKLEDLTLKDNFLFAAVMSYPDNCKELLQIILNIEIDHVEVDYEKSIIMHPEYHSIRLDVYVKDEHNTRYDIEMQVASQNLEKRARYYHSQMDLDILSKSVPYEDLPDSYVIFICDFDPFGREKYCYTVKKIFMESQDSLYDDGSYTIFLSTHGTNSDEVPTELREFLDFIKMGKESQIDEKESGFMRRIKESIAKIQRDRIWGERFMLLEELIEREKKETAITTLRDCIKQLAEVKKLDHSIIDDVESCNDLEELNKLFKTLLNS